MTADADRPVLVVEDLVAGYGDETVLEGVSFEVRRGEIMVVLGATGSGKSTTLRCIVGLVAPRGGRVLIDGRDINAAAGQDREDILRGVGLAFQEAALLNSMTTAENVALPIVEHWRADVDTALMLARMRLARVGLARAGDKMPSELSGGMRKRASLARALALDPELLLLDEPMNGLDPGGMLDMRRMIRTLVEEEGRTVFISSHLLDEIEKTCDVAAIIDRGRVITEGPIDQLVAGGTGELIVECDDAERALSLLAGEPAVRDLRREHGGLRMKLRGPEQAGEINARLVSAGVVVTRLEPVRHSLEERFLEMTTRLEVAA
jgi:ABC-2 type transport system ATP-binding protein